MVLLEKGAFETADGEKQRYEFYDRGYDTRARPGPPPQPTVYERPRHRLRLSEVGSDGLLMF